MAFDPRATLPPIGRPSTLPRAGRTAQDAGRDVGKIRQFLAGKLDSGTLERLMALIEPPAQDSERPPAPDLATSDVYQNMMTRLGASLDRDTMTEVEEALEHLFGQLPQPDPSWDPDADVGEPGYMAQDRRAPMPREPGADQTQWMRNRIAADQARSEQATRDAMIKRWPALARIRKLG